MHLVKLYFSSTFPIKSSYFFFSLLTFLSFLFILFKSQPPALQKSWLTAACNHVDVDVDFTTAGDWDCVAAVERLPALHYSVDLIFLSFGIKGFIVELWNY